MVRGEALELLRAVLTFIAGAEPDGQRLQEMTCLAQNVWFEARGSAFADKLAVAQVVVNRVRDHLHPSTVCGVVFEPLQFSWTADGLPDNVELKNRIDRNAWLDSVLAAVTAFDGRMPDLAAGATHFHAETVSPAWAEALRYVATWGGHRYYADGRPLPSAGDGTGVEPAAARQASPQHTGAGDSVRTPGLATFWQKVDIVGLSDVRLRAGAAVPFAWLWRENAGEPAAGSP